MIMEALGREGFTLGIFRSHPRLDEDHGSGRCRSTSLGRSRWSEQRIFEKEHGAALKTKNCRENYFGYFFFVFFDICQAAAEG